MTTTPHRDGLERTGRLTCPTCGLSLEGFACPHCGEAGRYRHGIRSFCSVGGPNRSEWLSDATLEELALAVEHKSLRTAVEECLAGHEARSRILDALFAVRRDAWRVVAGDDIDGHCLEVGARFGRRSTLLAHRAETVWAVDHSLPHLRIVAERSDPEQDIVPIHTRVDRLPFPSGSFDTVVADLDRIGGDPAQSLERLGELVAPTGSMYVLASGWTRSTGLLERVGLDQDAADRRGHSARWYRRRCESMGYDAVEVYALLPTADRPLFCFNTAHHGAVAEFAQALRTDDGLLATVAARGLTGLDRLGLLRQCYPSYLIACGVETTDRVIECGEPLHVLGRARSVVLDSETQRVYKIPNCPRNERLTRREHQIVTDLRSRSTVAASSLPAGDLRDTSVGSVRVEPRLPGRSLSEQLSARPDAAGRVVATGLEWLARFQQSVGIERTTRPPGQVARDLSFEPADIAGHRPDENLDTLITSIHGDYLPGNLLVTNGRVTGVIDWEYGALEGSPAVDAGLLVLDVVNQVTGGLAAGLDRLATGGALADTVGRPLARYCETVELPTRTFVTDLPRAYIHRLELDWRVGTTSTVSSRMDRRARAVELVAERRQALGAWLESYR